MQAIQFLKNEKPDLILLDIMLPGLSGLELLNLMSVEYETRKIPVIIISKMGEERIIETARQLGAEDYLVKPFTPEELIEKISAALN